MAFAYVSGVDVYYFYSVLCVIVLIVAFLFLHIVVYSDCASLWYLVSRRIVSNRSCCRSGCNMFIGRLMNERLAPYLGGTSLEGIASFGDDQMLTSQEMSTMAIVWLKIISESYPKDDVSTSSLGVSSMLCCGAANYVSDENEMIESSGNDSEVQASLNAGGELLENPVYAERVIDDLEEEEIRQKNMENYIQTLVNETTMNRNKGVKCYVYSAATTANGTCVSAGAAVPQRRPRPRENKKPAAGCC